MTTQVTPSDLGIRAILDVNPVVGEKKAGTRRFWTGPELKKLREHYPTGGVDSCLANLPGRSASAIYNQAGLLGLRSDKVRKNDFREKRWTTNDHIDALITRTYQSQPKKSDIQKLAQTIARPRWWVSKRAAKLGLVTPRFKEPEWSEDEIEFICARAHIDPGNISKAMKKRGWKRTATSIVVKLKRLGQARGRNADPDHWTALHLANLLGVDGKVVTGWIAKGWLKADRRGTGRTEKQGGDEWWISRKSVRAFVIANASIVDLRKVDRVWFIDMLANGGGA